MDDYDCMLIYYPRGPNGQPTVAEIKHYVKGLLNSYGNRGLDTALNQARQFYEVLRQQNLGESQRAIKLHVISLLRSKSSSEQSERKSRRWGARSQNYSRR